MSPATAGCFLLASLSSFVSLPPCSGRSLRWLAAVGLAGALLVVSLVFLLAYGYGKPLLYGSGFIPPAINTSLAFTFLGVGLLVAVGRKAGGPEEVQQKDRGARWFLLVFLLLAVGLVGAGYKNYQDYERHYRAELGRELFAIADLKVSELNHWREERLADGSVLLGHEVFSDLVQLCIEAPSDVQSRARLTGWLRQVREAHHYDRVFLLDAGAVEIASVPATPEPVAPHLRTAIPESLQSRQVSILDFHRDGPGLLIHLSVLVPIFATQDAPPLGVLVLQIDPALQLYPIIQRWPTASRTAETLIVRRDGNEVLFLNELRFRKGTALSLRSPLSNQRMPAVRAVRGHEGNFEGVDYRGVEVIAELRSVPDSPWFLVTRIDAAEVYGPLTERLWQMVFLVVGLLLGSGAALRAIWRQQTIRFYRERLEAAETLRASETELRERNDELTRFTYTVSHDLKSPLVTIQTFLGFLEKDLVKQDVMSIEKDFGFIRTAAQKMSRMLEELLELSRVGRLKNPSGDIPLQTVVEEALALVAGQVASRGAQIEVTQEPIVLHGDRVRLVEVFQNLVDNAIKFMGDQSSPLVEIGVESREQDLVLFVRDNGVGIDRRHMSNLFGLFEKLDPKSEGTGIGLALVRRIVEVHGGRIWVESAGRGHGACFRFTLAGTRRAPGKEVG